MPLRNRVTPFGEIVAMPERGLFTGNRGIIHDPTTRRLLSRRWATKAWIVCTCDYKGTRRSVMGGQSWTELFFLDEATALAAGHRPCFLCRRDAAESYREAWAKGNRVPAPSAGVMDTTLHRERLQRRRHRLHVLTEPTEALPDGAMIAAKGQAYLIAQAKPFLWVSTGYQHCPELPFVDGLLTPPSTVSALRAGYQPVLHSSCAGDPTRLIPERGKDIQHA